MTIAQPDSIDALTKALQDAGYFADRRLATAVFLALRLQRPLLLEGEPGVGKTELAKSLATVLGRVLLRLQCYDGLELREALYEWNYAAQLLHMRAAEVRAPTLGTDVSSLPPEGASAALGRPGDGGTSAPTLGTDVPALPPEGASATLGRPGGGGAGTPTLGTDVPALPPEGASAALGRPGDGRASAPTLGTDTQAAPSSQPRAGFASRADEIEREVYQERYLIHRPLLQALQTPPPGAVLLIDEVDRADEPFEAFLLEYLGEYQVSIPELGTVRAAAVPVTILTSNRTRELNDAVKRRCLYHWLDYPERERELAIVQAQVPQARADLSRQVAEFVGRLRSTPFAGMFTRAPGIAESVEWAKALVALDTLTLDPEIVSDTAGILFKQREDVAALTRDLAAELLAPEPAADPAG